jgi:hypothetical protein
MPAIPRLSAAVAALSILATMAVPEVRASGTITLSCPLGLTATWAQAANGRTNNINGTTSQLTSPTPPGPTTTDLTCALDPPAVNGKIEQVVQLEPGSVASACGAFANFTGLAQQTGGVPPFGGFKFKSSHVFATPTYTESTGRCQLDIKLAPTLVTLRLSAACKPISSRSWSCPDTVQQRN